MSQIQDLDLEISTLGTDEGREGPFDGFEDDFGFDDDDDRYRYYDSDDYEEDGHDPAVDNEENMANSELETSQIPIQDDSQSFSNDDINKKGSDDRMPKKYQNQTRNHQEEFKQNTHQNDCEATLYEEVKLEEVGKPILQNLDSKIPYFVINCPIYMPQDKRPVDLIPPILALLEENGLKPQHKDQGLLKKHVKIVFGLNRKGPQEEPLNVQESLDFKTDIEHKFIAFQWEEMESQKKSEKKQDRKKIPFRYIREKILRSQETENFCRMIRIKDPNAHIYITIIDDDTRNFNQIFSSYIDYFKSCQLPPAVMTTGYEFAQDPRLEESIDKDQLRLLWFASRLDRIVRLSTTSLIPRGVYYPEPNLCIYLPQGHLQMPECFYLKGSKGKYLKSQDPGLEAPCILKQIKREPFCFIDKPPLITAVPKDVKEMKAKSIKKVRQNHFLSRNWAKGLFYNQTILKGPEEKSLGLEQSDNKYMTCITTLQTLFATFDAQGLWRKLVGKNQQECEQILENEIINKLYDSTQLKSNICDESLANKIVKAAKFSQINALLCIQSLFFPLTPHNDEYIINNYGILFYLKLYARITYSQCLQKQIDMLTGFSSFKQSNKLFGQAICYLTENYYERDFLIFYLKLRDSKKINMEIKEEHLKLSIGFILKELINNTDLIGEIRCLGDNPYYKLMEDLHAKQPEKLQNAFKHLKFDLLKFYELCKIVPIKAWKKIFPYLENPGDYRDPYVVDVNYYLERSNANKNNDPESPRC